MPSTFTLPPYPITVYGEPESRKAITVGSEGVTVDGEAVTPGTRVVVDRATEVAGNNAYVTVDDTEDKATKRRKT